MTIARQWFENHAATLQDALAHWRQRDFYPSPYPEIPSEKLFGDGAADAGRARFDALLQQPFALDAHPADAGDVGGEQSPYGFALGIRYPRAAPQTLTAHCASAMQPWQRLTIDERAGVLLESLHRLSQDSFCLAHAVMHTSGQAFMMAFQAGAAHAFSRGLEALAAAHGQLRDIPASVEWEKPQGKRPPQRLHKHFRAMPRGVSLVIACSTFPTWNSYPAIFANLLCGNGVIIKPHPGAVLPLALTVRLLRQVLSEAGADPNLVLLAADDADAPITTALADDPAVRLIDYTGNSAFGNALEARAANGKRVFTEKAGVNCVLIDAVSDLDQVAANLAFSLSLYSGQMCTTPQNLFVPRQRAGDIAHAMNAAFENLLGDAARAVEILGAIQSPATLERRAKAAAAASVFAEAPTPAHAQFPDARLAAPLLVDGGGGDTLWQQEWFGPISFLIPTDSSDDALARMTACMTQNGALTAGVYADDDALVERVEQQCAACGAQLAINLHGAALINHSAAFSDMHGSGANAAANAALTDAAYIAPRYYIAQSRRLAE